MGGLKEHKLYFIYMWLSFGLESTSVVGEYKLDQSYQCPTPDCDRIISVQQHRETRNIYVTTRQTVKELDENLNEIHDRRTNNVDQDSENVLTILGDTEFILCRNDHNGTCELRDIDTLDLKNGYSKGSVVPTGGGQPVGWIDTRESEQKVLNIAITGRESQGGVPLLATRRLPYTDTQHSALRFLDYLEDGYSTPVSYFKSGPCLDIDIEPFYGFSTESYRYVLKKHGGMGKGDLTEIKIGQLCKDAASYRSYAELPIECNRHETAHSSNILSAAAHFVDDYLYISVTRNNTQGILETLVCNYSIAWMNDEFRQRRRECLEAKTETTELSWVGYNSCPTKPLPPSKFNFSKLDEDDFCYDLDTAHPLGGTKPIQQAPMEFLTRNDVITSILVVTSDDEGTTYIHGDKEGYIHKIVDGITESEAVDVGREILHTGGLLLHPDEDRLYASTSSKIMLTRLGESWTTERPIITSTQGHPGGGHETFNIMYVIIPVGIVAFLLFAGVPAGFIYRKRRRDSE